MDPRPLCRDMSHFVGGDIKTRSRTAKHYSRTARPTKYYLTDFNISRQYSVRNAPEFLEDMIKGRDKSVPEFRSDPLRLHNPFPTDVYYLGNAIRQTLLKVNLLKF